ncbi:GNAT family N-acetyltransferase [Kibdelosporangium aridum]|uniref:GNAT family N-acetyltransferase n=1 Tax=Kibdelosporangium aridum TaxID=2030 RepID=UPI000527559B
MEARVYDTAAEFREVAGPLLAADPITNTVVITATARPWPGALLITLHDNGKLVGAVIRTPPYPLLVSAMPAAVAAFTAQAVHDLLPDLPAATGPLDQVEAFVAAWTKITGGSATRTTAHRLFRLDKLEPPTTAGAPRAATRADLPMLIDWTAKFIHEALPPQGAHPIADEVAEQKLEPGAVSIFWEVDGTPVSVASARGPLEGMARIAPVYTPPEHRGHGYASAATAAASQWALDRGAEHVLITTDLANPTTNRIYPAIGFRPVHDLAEYRF